jgi:hypothetical protein
MESVHDFVLVHATLGEQPVITSPPRLHVSQQDDSPIIPRRSGRLAAKSKFQSSKPDVKAHDVLMTKKCGVLVETRMADNIMLVVFRFKNFSRKTTITNLTTYVWSIKYRRKKLIAQFRWKSRDERFELN